MIFWTWLTSISCPWPIRMGELIVTALHTYVLVLVCRYEIMMYMFAYLVANFDTYVLDCRYEFSQTSRRMWRKNRSACPTPILSLLGFWKGDVIQQSFGSG